MSAASSSRVGRPRASSRDAIAEAACELFLERGYQDTSVTEIARRAGVGRSSFFNYFTSKADVLWGGLDARILRMEESLAAQEGAADPETVGASVRGLVSDFTPDALALAYANAQAMGVAEELQREDALRRGRIAAATARALRASGMAELSAEMEGARLGAAVLVAVKTWALQGAGRHPLAPVLDSALALRPPH